MSKLSPGAIWVALLRLSSSRISVTRASGPNADSVRNRSDARRRYRAVILTC